LIALARNPLCEIEMTPPSRFVPLALAFACACQPPSAAEDKPQAALEDGTTQLAKHYAMAIRSHLETQDTTDQSRSTVDLALISLATVTHNGAQIAVSLKACHLMLPTVAGHQPSLADSVLQAAPAVELSGKLAGSKLTLGPGVLVLGAKLADPMGDPLPQDAGDPTVFDQDHDGHPGVSLHITFWGNIYAAARVIARLSAEVASPDSLDGTAQLNADFSILGDDLPFVNAHDSAAQAAATTKILSRSDTFQMRVLNAGSAGPTCGNAVQLWM
jgi:hypothetical protein